VSCGYSPSVPTADTVITPGTLPGNCTAPPELPAPTMQAIPFNRASVIFLCTSSEKLLATDTDLDDIHAPLDALIQCIKEIAEVTARYDFEYMHFSAGRTADNVGRCKSRGRDNAGAMGALSHLVRFPTLRVLSRVKSTPRTI